MKGNFINLSILYAVWLLLTVGCGEPGPRTMYSTDTRDVVRGRLIYPYGGGIFYVKNREWAPADDPDLAKKINWCDTSPNPKVEILRCFDLSTGGDWATYIIGMKNDEPYVLKTDKALPAEWIDEDGRWILFKTEFFNVETGEKSEVKGIPHAGDRDYLFNLIGVSPDRQMIVTTEEDPAKREGNEMFIVLQITDAATGVTEKRKVSFTKNPWLLDRSQADLHISPPPLSGRKLVWVKDQKGKYQLDLPK